MEVTSIEEQEDGSAIVELKMSQEENNFLVEYAVVDILKKQIERCKDEHRASRNNGEIQSEETSESKDK